VIQTGRVSASGIKAGFIIQTSISDRSVEAETFRGRKLDLRVHSRLR